MPLVTIIRQLPDGLHISLMSQAHWQKCIFRNFQKTIKVAGCACGGDVNLVSIGMIHYGEVEGTYNIPCLPALMGQADMIGKRQSLLIV